MRFEPPRFVISGELNWVLGRAFGPPADRELGQVEGPNAAVDAADALGLVERLVSRSDKRRLRMELGNEPAERLAAVHREAALWSVRLLGHAHHAALIAREASVPVVFLKFAALDLGGHVATGTRGAADIDLLASPGRARCLQTALIRAGWIEADQPEFEHQLRPLLHPSGGSIEVHTCILGVRLDGKSSATLDQLEDRGFLASVDGLPAGAFVPTVNVLIAHALAHGIAQHGLAPRSYPLFRMAADLIDLGFTTASERLLETVSAWLDGTLSSDEISEAFNLCRALESGTAAALELRNESGSTLLRHILAGTFDSRYEASLRAARVLHPLSDRPRLIQLASAAWNALWPTGSQMELIYGPSRSALRRTLRRIWRPFDLLRSSRRAR